MPSQIAERVLLKDRAIATSGGYGTQFDSAGRFNHIFDPTNGTLPLGIGRFRRSHRRQPRPTRFPPRSASCR
jgi:hypothetical protein